MSAKLSKLPSTLNLTSNRTHMQTIQTAVQTPNWSCQPLGESFNFLQNHCLIRSLDIFYIPSQLPYGRLRSHSQNRAMAIVYQNITVKKDIVATDIATLEQQKSRHLKTYFVNMQTNENVLNHHYQRDSDQKYSLRIENKYQLPTCKTSCLKNTLIQCGLFIFNASPWIQRQIIL